jgi:lysophospholipase L1-like esterase
MADHSRRRRFRPIFGILGLESRSLLSVVGSAPIADDEASAIRTSAVVSLRGAALPSRPIFQAGATRRTPPRPPGRPIVPSRNVTSVELPGLLPAGATMAAEFRLEGARGVRVTIGAGASARAETVESPPIEPIEVAEETYAFLPIFDQAAFGWLKGQRLTGVTAQEGVIAGALDADSVEVRLAGEPDGEPLARDVDYRIDPYWGTIGRIPGGRLGSGVAVTIRYRYVSPRLDAVILQADGQIVLRPGTPSNELPESPRPEAGEKLLGRIFVRGTAGALSAADLFPVLSAQAPSYAVKRNDMIASKMPKLMRKLRSGDQVTIMAWGDSVTDGRYLDEPETQRWQDQFVAALTAKYPQANVRLITEAWPGHGSGDYLTASPGDPKRFETAVVGQKPDLVISEFVNDAYLGAAGVSRQYGQIRSAFKRAGIEWIVLTPHFTHPAFMGFDSEAVADRDPRSYTEALRRFGAENRVTVADASLYWADLKRQGLPYTTLLKNGINHPNAFGMSLYSQALMAYF